MDWLEEELKQALARKDAPPDFPARIGRAVVRRRFAAPRWMATAAAVVVAAGGTFAWREYQGRVAKDRVMTAMRITASRLNHIQARVREVRQ